MMTLHSAPPALALLVPYALTAPPAHVTPAQALHTVYTRYTPPAVDALRRALELGHTVDVGVATNLLATEAAFGVARLVFQDGHLSGLLGFESQGFLDAWGPVFFFAMIFAISMDYTVFLLSSAKEHWDRSGDAHEAAIGGLAHSGRTIFAAAGVMVAVFFTFASIGAFRGQTLDSLRWSRCASEDCATIWTCSQRQPGI